MGWEPALNLTWWGCILAGDVKGSILKEGIFMKVSRLQKLYSLKGTAELLEFIAQHPGATQKDLQLGYL